VPKQLTQYRIFIGSPGGLENERRCFGGKLDRFTAAHAEHRGVVFRPVGWEDTVGGVGRPQALINEDLKQCDYAVFVLHDRWGSPSGSGYTSGTEEEWALAEQLYEAKTIRNIMLFFKAVDPRQLKDPGPQLAAVLAFKKRIEEGKRYLFRPYATLDQFSDHLDAHLARWLNDHEISPSQISLGGLTIPATVPGVAAEPARPIAPPPFDYWIAEATMRLELEVPDLGGALFCARKAEETAESDLQWAKARNACGVVLGRLGKPDEAADMFEAVAERFSNSMDPDRRYWQARALFNQGVTLGALGRSEEAIAVYDDLLARFGTASEPALREQVAKALFNKGGTLGALGRSEEAIAVYDDLLARFRTASEPALREQVAKALVNKGVRLGALDRSEEAIAVYDDLLARFGTASEPALRERVAMALVNKGVRLGALDRGDEAIAVYDDVLARFGTASEKALSDVVAKARSLRQSLAAKSGRAPRRR
jgi:tetratricopeptide (TPR) repeat protein